MSRTAGPLLSLSFALLAMALILSAAAWGAHSATHGLPLAATGSDHVQPAGAPHDHNMPGQDKQDGGHDHLTGMSFLVAALFDGTPLAPPPLPAAELPPIRVATLALRARDPPPADPPRTA